MEKGIRYGVKIINDVSGLSYDTKTLDVLKKFKIPFVIHHSQGTPENMQNNPRYKNELLDIYDFFEKKIRLLRSFGIKHNNIIIDPGIGFGKNLSQNLKIIKNINKFKIGKYGLLMGVSRKSWINSIDKSNVNERLGGSLAPVLLSQNRGVDIYRVHDVKETFQAIKVFKRIECSK